MSVRLTDDEAWERITAAHTGVLTTLRSDGRPVTLPTWFAVLDRRIYVRTPRRAAKVARIRADARGSFLVESGRAWRELAAVMLYVRLDVLPDADPEARVAADAIDAKYAAFREPPSALPDATSRHYADRVVLRLTAEGRMLTWDNSRLRLRLEHRRADV